MTSILSIAKCAALACVAAALLSPQTYAAEPVRALLADGRVVVGVVDSRTDAERLWLRAELPEAQLSSGFEWGQVAEVTRQGAVLSQAETQTLATRKTALVMPDAELPPPLPEFRLDAAQHPFNAPLPTDKVGWIEIHAELGRWDAFVPSSGLLVTVSVFDERGAPAAVLGDIELTLLGDAARGGTYSRHPELQELTRAHHLVRPAEFANGRATYRLPFDRLHPDFDLGVSRYALVHARLGVNGQGVFEASDSFVRLRSFSPARDGLQHQSRQRLFRVEAFPRGGRR